jgi:D-arabinose 1-dehydrogenase-like Zn-dependent alcohol dehydrogenase
MMQGNFGPLPIHMQGHEGLGIVTKVGNAVNRPGLELVKVGEGAFYFECFVGIFFVGVVH